MIHASIQPTPPLSPLTHPIQPAGRGVATQLRSITNPTSLVVLLRGSGPVDLTLSTGQIAQWSVKSYPLSFSPPPTIAPPMGANATLTTDAVGFFSVEAVSPGGNYSWYVRFIDVEVSPPGPLDISTGPPWAGGSKAGYVAVCADYDCTVQVRLRGSDEQPSCYDDVRLGIIQNMDWVTRQTLYGVYCARRTSSIKGFLFEPIPRVASPSLDAGDPESFPFYATKVNPLTGALRTLNFEDSPGIVTPLLYNTALGAQLLNTEPDFARTKQGFSCFVLRKICGQVLFRSAIGARVMAAPNNYVVAGVLNWSLVFNQKMKEFPADSFNQKGYLAYNLRGLTDVSGQPNGIQRGNFQALTPPQDAAAAGFETFGPTATETNHVYDWLAQSGVLA